MKCLYCKKELKPAHKQTRQAWCCDECFKIVMEKIHGQKK